MTLPRVAFPQKSGVIVFLDAISADQWQAAQTAAAGLGLQMSGVELTSG